MKKATIMIFSVAALVFQVHAQTIVYVNQNAPVSSARNGTSWANAYTSLAQAIDNANPTGGNPVEIWLAKGVYRPTEQPNREASFVMKNHLSIVGGFAGTETELWQRTSTNIFKTILSGDIGVRQAQRVDETLPPLPFVTGFGTVPDPEDPGFADNVYNVVRVIGVSNVVLDGLLIAGGFADYLDHTNAALLIQKMSLPAVTTGTTTNITVFKFGGLLFTNVVVKDIYAERAEVQAPLIPSVAGGGIFVQDSFDRFTNVVNLILNDVYVVGNYARGYGGGLAGQHANILVANSWFENNRADADGGGAWGQGVDAVFQNVQFFKNRAIGNGGGMCVEVFPSKNTEPPGMSDAEEFEEAFGRSPDDFRQTIGYMITGHKLVRKLPTVLTTKGTLGAKLRYLLPSHLGSGPEEVLNKEKISGGGKIAGTYAWIQIGVMVGDIGYSLAAAFGADMDHPLARYWAEFSYYFNTYATPQGLATEAIKAINNEVVDFLDGQPLEVQAHFLKEFEYSFYNQSKGSVSLLQTEFRDNTSGENGGGLCCLYDNIRVESSTFKNNAAFGDGGAIHWGGWNTPFLISSVLSSNRSETGDSAIGNVGQCKAQIVNCTIVNNYSDETNGYAVGNQLGAEVRLGNSILWNNRNAALTNGGADIFTATKSLLNPDTLALYDKAGPAYGHYVAVCDINHCIVQSLDTLPEGRDEILLFDIPLTFIPQDVIDAKLEQRKLLDETGLWEFHGFTHTGEGNRPGLKTLKGNSKDDPMLGPDGITPMLGSPAINAGNPLRLDNGVVNTVTGLDALGNPRLVEPTFDIGAVERDPLRDLDGSIVFVRTNAPGSNLSGTNWANAMTNLQQALSMSNRMVFVAEGTYRPSSTGDRFESFVFAENLQVYGGFKNDGSQTALNQRNPALHETILSGDIGVIGNDSDNSFTVVKFHVAEPGTILDGFTITKGRGDGTRVGGGIYSVSRPQIVNCRFVDNRAFNGGAIYASAEEGPFIKQCTFIDNYAESSGGAISYLGRLSVKNSTFSRNRSSLGGAISTRLGDVAEIFNCLFENNSVTGDSTGARGGAIDAASTNLRLQNNTFYRNSITANFTQERGGGAVHFLPSTTSGPARQVLYLENNIFWENFVANSNAPAVRLEYQQIESHVPLPPPTNATSLHLCFNNIIHGFQQFTDNGGNLDADPQFIDPIGGNFRLSSYSPAVEGGRPFVTVNFPIIDLDGSPRFSGERIDMGAYEFQGTPTPLANDVVSTRQCGETSLTYSVVYTGTNGPGLQFQWQVSKNDGLGFTNISNGGFYAGVTTTTLTISNPSLNMNGYRYRVVVTGVVGLTSDSTFITVRSSRFYVREGGTGNRNGSSWSNAFENIYDALGAAAECAQIWVAAGTYYPAAVDRPLPMRSNIGIYGGFAGNETSLNQRNWRTNVTIISGNRGDLFSTEDDSATLADSLNSDATAILDGFTLRDARNTALAISSANPAIRNCIFMDNRGSFGGAVQSRSSSSPTFVNCEFRNNYAGNGGAAAVFEGSTNHFLNCLFQGNVSGHRGGAIDAEHSVVRVRNCTLADNRASSSGGGIHLSASQADVRNSILWGNTQGDAFAPALASQLETHSGSSFGLSNSVCQFGAGVPGGNTAFDPLFTNAPNGDLRLLAHSPAINTGNNADVSGWNADLDGNSRTNGGTVDRGAYEYQGANPTSTVLLLTLPASVSVCTGSDPIQFTVSGVTNPAVIYDWEVSNGGGFTTLSNDSVYTISATSSSSILTITNPTLALSSNLYRAVVRGTGYATPAATLTVNSPTPIFVYWLANGPKNGSSWANAFTNLQDALNVATPCNEIWVAMGTYRSSAPYLEMRPGVEIYGGFLGVETSRSQRNFAQNKTILMANPNQSVFLNEGSHYALNRNAILDGFTLRSTNTYAILNRGTRPTIQNCTFETPGVRAIFNYQANLVITNCVFLNGGGALFNVDCSPSILNCVFRGNNGSLGGAIGNSTASPLIDNCWFETNSATIGGAVFNDNNSSPLIRRSVFLRNRAGTGGGVSSGSGDLRIENSLFAYNEAAHTGGAIEHGIGSLTLLHVTVTENRTPYVSSGVHVDSGSVQLQNSILWNNQVADMKQRPTLEQQQLTVRGGTVSVINSCVQGNQTYLGNGNIAFDPAFAQSAPTNTFPLDPASPALNAGSNALSTNLAVDLAGAPRLAFGTVDMGAYESTSPASQQVRLLDIVRGNPVCSGDIAVFRVIADPSQSLQWQVDAGSGFTNVVSGGTQVITASGGTNTLQLLDVNPGMNGRRYRVLAAGAGFASRPATLSASAPTILYVNAVAVPGGNGLSWANAFTNVQQALNIADHCSEIWVAQGTYSVILSATGEDYFPLKAGVEMYGGFLGNEFSRTARNPALRPTILTGGTNRPSLIPSTLMANGETAVIDGRTVLDGFIVQAGAGIGINNYKASPTIRNCIIRNVPEAGIWNSINSHPLIDNCTFLGNQAGAIENRDGSSPTITNCWFIANHHDSGGAIANVLGNPVITACVFSNNTADFHGGAIYADKDSAITVRRSTFVGNSASSHGGAVRLENGASVLEQLLIYGNSAADGGAVSMGGSAAVTLVNCTVADNFASLEGSGIFLQTGGAMNLRNTIVWGNAIAGGTLTASNSWTPASGSAPLFLNPQTGDYRLSAFSPLINAGNNSWLTPAMTVDTAGNPRITQSTVDIGAYELQSAAQAPVLISTSPAAVPSGCFGNSALFSVAGSISGNNVIWQVDPGSGFTDVAGPAYTVSAITNRSALTVSGLAAGANYQVRYRLAGNTFTSAPVRLVIHSPSIVYVKSTAGGNNTGTSWVNAFTNLQQAIASSDCVNIWVAAGTYAATGSDPSFRMRSTVALYGGFNGTETTLAQRNWTNNPTILTTTFANNPVILNENLKAEVNPTAVLDGFRITGNGIQSIAAMKNVDASPTIRNCSISDQPIYAILNQGGSPTFSHCTFSNNQDTAVMNVETAATFSDCRFVDNQSEASGAALVTRQSTVGIQRCVFENNAAAVGGAVANLDDGLSIIIQSRFSGNSATFNGGAIYNSDGNAIVRNSLFNDNRALGYGGAVAQYSSGWLELVNCTVSGNVAALLGGGVYLRSGQGQINNSILWGNTTTTPDPRATLQGAQLAVEEGTVGAAHSIIEGLTASLGANNRDADPLFSPGSLVPGAFSPAIDGGNNAFVQAADRDLFGNVRQVGSVDMGAFESPVASTNTLYLAQFPQPFGTCDGNFATFSARAGSGTNYNFQWQRSGGGPFTNLLSGGVITISSNGAESRVDIAPVNTAMNGHQFRFVIASLNYTSPAVTLSVAPATVIFVNHANATSGNGSSWAQAVKTLPEAVAQWTECAEVWVASGAYVQTNGNGEATSVGLRSPMRIYGGFTGTETAREQRNWSNNITRVVAGGSLPAFENGGVSLVVNRLAVLDGLVFAGAPSVAVRNINASPSIRNCTFTSNLTAVVNRNGSAPLFENCSFLSNSNANGSAIVNTYSFPVFSDCLFAGNYAGSRGGAMWSSGGGATIVGTRFENNRSPIDGGALYFENDSLLDLSRSSFLSNRADNVGGAIQIIKSTARIANSRFAHNYSIRGGGAVRQADSTVTILNSTVADNQTERLGGGIEQIGGTLAVTNSIVWGNRDLNPDGNLEAAQIRVAGGAADVAQSIVTGLQTFTGNNNLPYDPLFVQPSANDYRLQAYSPAVNSGTNLSGIGALDLAGNNRIVSGIVDLGAHELAGAAGVGGPVRIVSMPMSAKVCTGASEAALFTVSGESNPAIQYSWEINTGSGWQGSVATNDGSHRIVTTASSSTLIVSNLSLAHNGNRYRFRVSSSSIPVPVYAETNGVLLTVSGPTVLYVKSDAAGNQSGTSWANAFTNLHAALATAASCSEIWVAAGTYRPERLGANSYAANLKDGVEIYGGFNGTENSRNQRDWTNNPTILRGDYRDSVLSAVGFSNPIGASTLVDGFIMQADGAVSGLSIAQAAPTIRNCRFENLLAIALPVSVGAAPRIENCVFINNRETAIDVRDLSSVTLSNVLFISNTTVGQGAAIHSMGTSIVQVANCTFAGNASQVGGGAILNQDGSIFTALNCVFSQNTGGAAVNSSAGMSLTNCLFARNHNDGYGGALLNSGNLTLVNCTVADNDATYGGSGIYQTSGGSTLRNTILWGNADNFSSLGNGERAQIESISGSVTASYSIIQGLSTYAGNANLAYDPIFTNAPAGNYQLEPGFSPARNAGNNGFLAGIATDLAGAPRFFETTVDIGAYEASSGVATPVQISSQPQSITSCPFGMVSFTVTGAAGLGNNVTWRVKAPSDSDFQPITPDSHYSIVTNSTASTLVVSNFATFNGYQFRYHHGTAFDPYRSLPVTLTVTPASTVYVRADAPLGGDGQSWAAAYNDLQSALAAVSVCRPEIWIASGTYRPTAGTNRNVAFDIPPAARIYGGFFGTETALAQRNLANPPTILSGDIGLAGNAADNSINVVLFDGLAHAIGTNTVLDGVTIEQATGGTGLVVFQASPTVRHCVSRQNRGSGLSVTGGNPRFEQCSFSSNAANFGGGASVADATPAFVSCTFSGNTATNGGGGLHAQNSSVSLTNCLVSGNVAPLGGGLNLSGGTANLVNNTLAANAATSANGAGLFAVGTISLIRNSLLWHNAANGSRSESAQLSVSGGSANVAYTGIQGLSVYTGNQNSNFDPVFSLAVAPELAPTTAGDHRLQSCSPALNAGLPAAAAGIATDLDGNPRSVSGVDLGAYEYPGANSTAVIINQHPSNLTYCPLGTNFFEVQLLAAPGGTTAQWEVDRHNGSGFVAVTDGVGYSGATSTTLLLTDAITAMDGEDYRLRLQTPLGCVAYSAIVRLRVPPPQRYVRWNAPNGGDGLSWATAYNNLRTALQNTCGTELWVAVGTYTPMPGDPSQPFALRNGLAVYGGFAGTESNRNQRDWVANVTILEGETGAGQALQLVLASGLQGPMTNGVRLDGFTLQHARKGIRIEFGASLTVENCVIRQNQMGAEVWSSSNGRFVKCDFVSNFTPDFFGAGLHVDNSTFYVDRCFFRGNQASSSGAGARVNQSSGEFVNSLFTGNYAGTAAALGIVGTSAVTLRHCTITGNRADGVVGGISGTATLINSIVWNNRGAFGFTADAQFSSPGGTSLLSNSIVQNLTLPRANFAGNVINTDPLFLQPLNTTNAPTASLGDLRFVPCSSAYNAGNTAASSGAFDIAGNPRALGAAVDIGAYESTIGPALSLTAQPGPQGGGPQDGVQYVVAASGTNLTYQWEVNRTGSFVTLTNDASHNGAATPVLTVSNLSAVLNGAQYRCRVQDAFGCVLTSGAATFTFFDYPGVTTLGATEIALSSARLNLTGKSAGPGWFFFQYGTTTNYGGFTGANLLSRYALDFNGTNQYLDTTLAVPLANASFTIEFWAKRAQMGRDDYFLVQGTGLASKTLHIGFRPNNSFTFSFWSNDLDVPAVHTDTNWHHWACTFNAGSRLRSVYRDGVLVATNTATADYTGTGIVNIGRLAAIGSFYKGSLDDIRIWSAQRSAAQIAATMNVSLTGSEPGLLANWKFDEGAGATAGDTSPSGNSATLFNAPSWSVSPVVFNSLIGGSSPISGLLAGTLYHFRAVTLNAFGAAYGEDFTFTTPAFLISAQPTNVTVETGNSVAFAVAVNFPQGTTYQWQSRASNAPSFQNIAGATNSNYTTAPLTVADSGIAFRVQIANGPNALTSDPAVATVTPTQPPTIATLAATEISTNSARLNLSSTYNRPASYYFEFGTTTNYGSFSATNFLPAYALNFNGTNQYLNTSLDVPLANASFTIEFWARRAQKDRQDFIVVQGTGGDVNNRTLHIGFRSNNNFTFAFWGNDLDVPAVYTDTNWHHWACTFDAVNLYRAIYLDGQIWYAEPASAAYMGTGTLSIARFPYITNYYRGLLDDVRVWTGARSADQIATNRNRSLNGNEPGLLANWKFDEGAGTIAADASPTGNTATLVNAPTWMVYPPVDPSMFVTGLLANTTYHFRAVAVNSFGTSYGQDLTFTTSPDRFMIMAQPTHVTVETDNPATFAVAVSFPQGATYQWQSRATNAAGFQDIPGATDNIYTTPLLTLVDNGTVFRVLTANGTNLLTSDEAVLTVTPHPPPTVATLPAIEINTNSARLNLSGTSAFPATYYFQYGTTTNYGSFSVTNALLRYTLGFDGGNGFASSSLEVPLVGSFTIECWAKREQMDRDDDMVAHFSLQGFYFGFRSNNKFTFGFAGNNLEVSPSYTDSNWHHWACTFDALTLRRTVYRDGVEVAFDVVPNGYALTAALLVGQSPYARFNGLLDELRIWTEARSAAQIAAHMNRDLLGNEPGLLSNWKFEEGSGNIALDSTPTGNSLSIFNGLSWIVSPVALDRSISVTGLLAGTVYHFRAVATSAYGTTFGQDLTFTTLALPSLEPVRLSLQLNQAQGNPQIQLIFTNQPGAQFTIVGTTNLNLPLSQWTVLGVASEISPGNFRFIDSGTTTRSQSFYRVRSP